VGFRFYPTSVCLEPFSPRHPEGNQGVGGDVMRCVIGIRIGGDDSPSSRWRVQHTPHLCSPSMSVCIAGPELWNRSVEDPVCTASGPFKDEISQVPAEPPSVSRHPAGCTLRRTLAGRPNRSPSLRHLPAQQGRSSTGKKHSELDLQKSRGRDGETQDTSSITSCTYRRPGRP
jgi:hypothetical protein